MTATQFNVVNAGKELLKGSVIEISRGCYSHYAMYIGDGQCVHLTCATEKPDSLTDRVLKLFQKGTVQIDDLTDILGDCIGIVKNGLDGKHTPKDLEEILSSANSMIGQRGYSPLFRNCETMCNYWRYGIPLSTQVLVVLQIVMAIGAGIVVGGIVKELLERKVGSFWSKMAALAIGCATALGLIFREVLEFDALSVIVEKISGFAMSGWISAVLSTCLGVGAVVAFGYGLYKLITSETFKSTVHSVTDIVYEFGKSVIDTLCYLGKSVADTLSEYGKWLFGY